MQSYQEDYKDITNSNICSNFFSVYPQYNFTGKNPSLSPNPLECSGNEFFTKGMSTILVGINEIARSINQKMKEQQTAQASAVNILKNSNEIGQMHTFALRVGQAIEYLTTDLKNSVENMLSIYQFINFAYLAMLTVLLVVIYGAIWNNYIKDLKNKIWRARGMLNMIPF